MPKIKILVKGYAFKKDNSEYASSTAVLIQDSALNIIVDPGMDRVRLLSALKKQGLVRSNIDYVVLTHNHLDHTLLSGIFNKAKMIDDELVYSWDGKITKHSAKIPGTDIKIIKTPGHSIYHCAVLVNTEKYGRVAIVGDVFWWTDSEKSKTDKKSLLQLKDPYVKNKQE